MKCIHLYLVILHFKTTRWTSPTMNLSIEIWSREFIESLWIAQNKLASLLIIF